MNSSLKLSVARRDSPMDTATKKKTLKHLQGRPIQERKHTGIFH
jgi:hypothetical protein